MTVSNSSPAPAFLTGGGTKDLLHTESGNSAPNFTFFNTGAAAATVTFYIGGTSAINKRAIIELDANGGFASVVDLDLGNGTTVYAEASSAGEVSYQKLVLNL